MEINFQNVNITGGFWKDIQDKNRLTTINAVYNRFSETGRFEAMHCNWKEGMEKKPHFFWDSDVAKWLEGAAYILAKHQDPDLMAKVEDVIDAICENQWEDGYYNVYYTVVEPDGRFKKRANHELYCAGHLFEAAVAYYEATGRDRFLNAMIKYAELIYKIFVIEQSADFVTPGHEEIELALLRLYRCTKNEKCLELCKFFIENRGKMKKDLYPFSNAAYDQNNLPVKELSLAEGHAVRAVYLYVAMADLAKEIGDEELFEACKRLFYDIVDKKMYITGGIGQTYVGEAFTVSYDLPSATSYTETCAAIGLMFFCQKMLENEIDSVYADTIERVMYNGMLSGLSADGKAFFYENPLEISVRSQHRHTSTVEKDHMPITTRREVFDCSCCPPNINRILASMENYIYYLNEDTVYVNQYMQSVLDNGTYKVTQSTDYPRNGKISITFEGVRSAALRIPFWCDDFTISAPYTMKNGYAYIDNPDFVEINFVMKPRLYSANAGS